MRITLARALLVAVIAGIGASYAKLGAEPQSQPLSSSQSTLIHSARAVLYPIPISIGEVMARGSR